MKNKLKLTVTMLLIVCIIAASFSACKKVEFKLDFIVDGETYTTITTNGNEIIEIPAEPTKDDCTFEGWFWDDGAWNRPFTENSLINEPISGNTSVYAKFTPNGDGDLPNPDNESSSYAKVIILSGQSNMFGSGTISDITEESVGKERYEKLSNPINNVKILMNEGDSLDDFKPLQLGVGHVWDYGFGPELGVAEYFSAQCPDETVYVIKYALSGTRLLDTWVSPSRTDREVTEAYNNLIKLIDNGLQILADANLNPKIVGFCWMQGESDTVIEEAVENYYVNQTALANDLRERYNESSYNNCMNFIDAKIGPYWTFGGFVNEAKLRFRNDDPEHNFILDTQAPNLVKDGVDGLTRLEDDIHYDSISVLKLGQMFAEQIYQATK